MQPSRVLIQISCGPVAPFQGLESLTFLCPQDVALLCPTILVFRRVVEKRRLYFTRFFELLCGDLNKISLGSVSKGYSPRGEQPDSTEIRTPCRGTVPF